MEAMEVDSNPPKANEERGNEEEEEGLYEYFAEYLPGLVHAIKMSIKETDLKCIDLKNLNLETEHMKAIFDLLPDTQVSKINAENNNLRWGMLDFVKQLVKSNVTNLSFKNCHLRVLHVLALMEVLQNTKISDLDLSDLSFEESYPLNSAKQFLALLTKSHLTHLRLSNSSLLGSSSGKDFAFHLPHTSITHLWLEASLRHDKQALVNLFTDLPKTSITELHVGSNEIEDDHVKPLSESLKESKLEVLDLNSNKITDFGINLLSAALVGSKVRQLDVANNRISGNNNLGMHLKDTSVTVLRLGGNKIQNDQMFSFPNFLKNTLVTELYLDSCDLGDETGRNLVKCLKFSEVSKLIFNGNHLGALTVTELAGNLKETKISEVDFSENDLSTESLQVLGECIQGSKLKHFMLRGGLNNFQEGSSIAAFVDKLKGSAIESLDISCNNFENSSACLAISLKNSTLTHLNLTLCQIGSAIADLAPALKLSMITHLNVSKNKIGDFGAEKLAGILKDTKILNLDVSDNFISAAGAKALVLCLKSGPLYHLNLSHNKVTSEGIEELAGIIEATFITNLDISYNSGRKVLPLVTELWRNQSLAYKWISFFSSIAPTDGRTFRIDLKTDKKSFNILVEKCFNFLKVIEEEPSCIGALANSEYVPFSRDQLVSVLDELASQLAALIKSKAKLNFKPQVKFMERAKALGVSKILDLMLRDLAALLLEDGLLMPKAFQAMEMHKELICTKVSSPKDKKKIMDKFAVRPICGLCGETSKLTRTRCCDNWICDDSGQYVLFSYARNSCYRNHDRYTLCAYHHNEGHPGKWQECDECEEEFDDDEFATNSYNFEKRY